MRKIALFLLFIVFILYPLISWAEGISLTLDEAISIALRDNRDILLKNEDLEKAKLKIAEAQAGIFPSFTATGGWIDTRGFYSKDVGVTSAQLGVKQFLYKGGKIINTIKANEYDYIVTEAVLDKTKLETVLNTKKAFYTLLLADEYAAINKGIADNTKEHLALIRARFAAGESAESDLLKIESSLSSVNEIYVFSLNQVESARESLKNILYIDKNVILEINGSFSCEPLEIAYDEAFLKAMQQRPEIKQYEAQARSDEKGIEIAKADTRPSVYAAWDYYSRSHLSSGTTRNVNDYNIFGVTVSWPIFDGWLTKSKVDQAIVDLRQTRLLNEQAVKDIALEVKIAYLDLKNAIDKIKTVNIQNKVYADNLSVIQKKYNAGISSELDLHDAKLQIAVALFNEVQANYDYLIAKARFDKATGGPL